MKMRTLPFLLSLCLTAGALAQGNRGNAEVTIKGNKISINYGRPSLGGQASRVGELPVGQVWRVGMNQATEIATSGDLVVGGTTVKAGKYTLWVKRAADKSYILAFHPKTGIWGKPEMTEGYVAQAPLAWTQTSTAVDPLAISLADEKGKAALKIQWGKDVLAASFDVK